MAEVCTGRGSLKKIGELPEGSEAFQVEISELEHFLLGPGDDAISILSFAENACGEGGRK